MDASVHAIVSVVSVSPLAECWHRHARPEWELHMNAWSTNSILIVHLSCHSTIVTRDLTLTDAEIRHHLREGSVAPWCHAVGAFKHVVVRIDVCVCVPSCSPFACVQCLLLITKSISWGRTDPIMPNQLDFSFCLSLSRPPAEPCVPAFPRKRRNWKTQAHTGRLFCGLRSAFEQSLFPINWERLDAGIFTPMLPTTKRKSRTCATRATDVIFERKHCSRRRRQY